MRVISGIYKRRRFDVPNTFKARPTTDFAKENLFNVLNNLVDFEECDVLDLFAGSGQMGLEALSRGAERATFIDSSREAMEIVKKNAKSCGFFDASHFLVSDFRNYIRKASGREKFDLVFIDPPYGMKCCSEAAALIAKSELIIPGAIVVLESGEEEIAPPL